MDQLWWAVSAKAITWHLAQTMSSLATGKKFPFFSFVPAIKALWSSSVGPALLQEVQAGIYFRFLQAKEKNIAQDTAESHFIGGAFFSTCVCFILNAKHFWSVCCSIKFCTPASLAKDADIHNFVEMQIKRKGGSHDLFLAHLDDYTQLHPNTSMQGYRSWLQTAALEIPSFALPSLVISFMDLAS